ncbi:hypothetical protein Syun_021905 [Stephania yunnanensis]|uniref:LysM domain-containing protein n=1 Tax=Stephania yunnanensis TaxID=152371 RepID=A0AAP0IGM4_9MAGN
MSSDFGSGATSSAAAARLLSADSGSDGNGLNYIEHHVSRMDTLAGVAIKYGVEVADIKRMNGLATDLQMFALQSLKVPLPGRHPPSSSLSNGSASQGDCSIDQMQPRRASADGLESFQSYRLKSPQRRVSPAMSRLQGYYGLKPPIQRNKSPNHRGANEGMEMAVYKTGSGNSLEDGLLIGRSLFPDQSPIQHQGYGSLVNGFSPVSSELTEDGPGADSRNGQLGNSNDIYVFRPPKPDEDLCRTPEMLLKEENSGGTGFLARTGKGLALRPKSASRTNLAADADLVQLKPVPVGSGDTPLTNGLKGVRKSSSTSNLQDQNEDLSIFSASKWNWKTDLQTLTTTPITKPLFDGLPKPITGRRSKAALD